VPNADAGAIGHFLHLHVGAALGEEGACCLDDARAVEAGIGASREHERGLPMERGLTVKRNSCSISP
jgi:hypothetical protein